MREKGKIFVHFIEECNDCILSKRLLSRVPRVGDELRLGWEGNEQYYKITRVTWVYHGPGNLFERVDIGIVLST